MSNTSPKSNFFGAYIPRRLEFSCGTTRWWSSGTASSTCWISTGPTTRWWRVVMPPVTAVTPHDIPYRGSWSKPKFVGITLYVFKGYIFQPTMLVFFFWSVYIYYKKDFWSFFMWDEFFFPIFFRSWWTLGTWSTSLPDVTDTCFFVGFHHHLMIVF